MKQLLHKLLVVDLPDSVCLCAGQQISLPRLENMLEGMSGSAAYLHSASNHAEKLNPVPLITARVSHYLSAHHATDCPMFIFWNAVENVLRCHDTK